LSYELSDKKKSQFKELEKKLTPNQMNSRKETFNLFVKALKDYSFKSEASLKNVLLFIRSYNSGGTIFYNGKIDNKNKLTYKSIGVLLSRGSEKSVYSGIIQLIPKNQ